MIPPPSKVALALYLLILCSWLYYQEGRCRLLLSPVYLLQRNTTACFWENRLLCADGRGSRHIHKFSKKGCGLSNILKQAEMSQNCRAWDTWAASHTELVMSCVRGKWNGKYNAEVRFSIIKLWFSAFLNFYAFHLPLLCLGNLFVTRPFSETFNKSPGNQVWELGLSA